MSEYWQTASGEEIPYNKLEDSHLLNILRYIEKRAKHGIQYIVGDCYGTEYCGDIEFTRGMAVKDLMDYEGLIEEAKKRNLLKAGER